jgi:PilX N-terminal
MYYQVTHPTRQKGVALIVALILLMVLTMIAVVAMRTTTLDLKMTTNQTLLKRTFQSSESARMMIREIVDSHSYFGAWPVAVGGTVPAHEDFEIPAEFTIDHPTQTLYFNENGEHWEMTPDARDMGFRIDADNDGSYESASDMAVDLFISVLVTRGADGSDLAQLRGYEGIGFGAAGAGAHIFYRVLARAAGAGATQATTEALYRYTNR